MLKTTKGGHYVIPVKPLTKREKIDELDRSPRTSVARFASRVREVLVVMRVRSPPDSNASRSHDDSWEVLSPEPADDSWHSARSSSPVVESRMPAVAKPKSKARAALGPMVKAPTPVATPPTKAPAAWLETAAPPKAPPPKAPVTALVTVVEELDRRVVGGLHWDHGCARWRDSEGRFASPPRWGRDEKDDKVRRRDGVAYIYTDDGKWRNADSGQFVKRPREVVFDNKTQTWRSSTGQTMTLDRQMLVADGQPDAVLPMPKESAVTPRPPVARYLP